jgi:hypothetical protein
MKVNNLTRSKLGYHVFHLRDCDFIGINLYIVSCGSLSDIIEEILELLLFVILIHLHVKHAPSEFFKHQCSTHSTVLVEYLFVSLLLCDLFDLHDIRRKIYSPNHPNRYPLGCILNVSMKFGEVNAKLRDSIGDAVSVKELLKLMLTNNFEGALGIHKVEENLFEFCV